MGNYDNFWYGLIYKKIVCYWNRAIAFIGTSGVQMGWLASQADMLANDWMFAE